MKLTIAIRDSSNKDITRNKRIILFDVFKQMLITVSRQFETFSDVNFNELEDGYKITWIKKKSF